MPSLFFMSLALGTEAEKGSRARSTRLLPVQGGEGQGWGEGHLLLHGVPPLEVPIPSEVHASEHRCRAPTLLPGTVCCKHPRLLFPTWYQAATVRAAAEHSLESQPPGRLDSQAQARLGLRQEEPGNGRTRDGSREKKNPPGQP